MTISVERTTAERNTIEDSRRAELAAFLKACRARLRPEDVGLPVGVRRRAEGLRREEVAQLAGVGLSWYTWLEQGRPIKASTQVLDAVAQTLRMDAVEREHMHVLAGAVPLRTRADALVVPESVHDVLRCLDPLPATLSTTQMVSLGSNDAFREVFKGWHNLPCLHHNALWCTITEPNARDWLPDYDHDVAYQVAMLRAAYAHNIGDPEWEENIARLSDLSSEFAELWARHEVAEPRIWPRRFAHPEVGVMSFTIMQLDVAAFPELRINVYTPVDQATWEQLAAARQCA
jgi:transcriptional regulator with XRE-family HTH domain